MSLQFIFVFCKNKKAKQQQFCNPSSDLLTNTHHFFMLVSLAGQEQQLQPQMEIGSVSPRSAEQGVDIMQMLTKARDDYDKVTHPHLDVFFSCTSIKVLHTH